MRILLLCLSIAFAEMPVKNLDPFIYFYKTYKGQLQEKEDQIESRKETIAIEARLAELEANTAVYIIPHDHSWRTNTVVATLDASTSFDAGTAAQYHFVTVPVYNKDKPICIKWEDDCDDQSNKGLFEELNNLFKGCECEEYLEDECGNQVYETECAKYREDCIDEEDCECIEHATRKIEYVDACEYRKLNHADRLQYVRHNVRNIVFDDLSYSWEMVTGPHINVELFDRYKNQPVLRVELTRGDYRFVCIVSDPYQYESRFTKDVKVIAEPNNDPEVQILVMDVATTNYVNALTAGKGRIITLKCPWIGFRDSMNSTISESCEPPAISIGNAWNTYKC